MTKEKIREFTVRITGANKTGMIVILYDIALQYISDAKESLKKDERKRFRDEIGHVRATLGELSDSVDTSSELGMTMLRLYIFCNRELTKAFLDYDCEALSSVENIFSKFRDAYFEKSREDDSEPVMMNTERVFAGLTYNKNSMAENITAGNLNRGYLV